MNVNYANGTSFNHCMKSFVSILLLSFALSCCIPIAVTFIPRNQIWRVRMRRKGEKLIYNIGIECFLGWYSDRGQKFIFLRMLISVQNRISAARQTLKNHNFKTVDQLRACK
jgi:hypothetical protein